MSKYIDIINEGTVHNLKTNYEQNYVDTVQVVRCRDCVMWGGSFTLNGQKKCLNMTFCTDGDFYCGWGTKNE